MTWAPMDEEDIRRTVEAWEANGHSRKRVAEIMGLSSSAVQRRLEAADRLVIKGTSTLYDADDNVTARWDKTRLAGRDPAEVVHLPDPKKITKISTLYDQLGQVSQQWVSEKPEDAEREKLWQDCAKAMASELPPVGQIEGPRVGDMSLLTVYPVGDHHLGMLSWDAETGANYDLGIGERLLMGATDYLVEKAPASERALVVFLGDLLHYDSFDAVTPTSRNLLDADSRYPKVVRAAIRAVRYLIEAAARKHVFVHVIVEIGNHDLSSSIFLMECLANIYAGNSRITIDTSPAHYHYYEFGANLIATHHGHGAKTAQLPQVMAADRPEAWGRTKHRVWLTGHVHHQSKADFQGCSVESFRILAPADAWAAQKGYRSIRDMKALVFHARHGEVSRMTVNPEMLNVEEK